MALVLALLIQVILVAPMFLNVGIETANAVHVSGHETFGGGTTGSEGGGQTGTGGGEGGGQTGTGGGEGGGQTGGGGGGGCGSGALCNPLKFGSITAFLLAIIDVLLILAVPIIIFFIIYAGYLFVTAQGNETKLTTARSAFTWAVVGGVIVLGAKIIIEVIQSTVAGFQ